MGLSGDSGRLLRVGRFAAVALSCVTLANCSNSKFSSADPKYGVPASARVVADGQPVPKGGGAYRVGKPYVVGGRTYVPEEDTAYSMVGMASWYGDDFHGRYTANGEVFDMHSISAAHPTLPMPSYVRVTNLKNHKSIVVRVNDRGPYANNRIIDVSVKTAQLLGFYGHGLAKVKVEYVGRAPVAGSDDRKLMATLREGDQPKAAFQVAAAGDFAPYFDSRPIAAKPLRRIPSPPDRPYAGDGEAVQTDELAASRKPQEMPQGTPTFAQRYAVAAPAAQAPLEQRTTPVSAFAPARAVRYDAPAGFMSGRGLY